MISKLRLHRSQGASLPFWRRDQRQPCQRVLPCLNRPIDINTGLLWITISRLVQRNRHLQTKAKAPIAHGIPFCGWRDPKSQQVLVFRYFSLANGAWWLEHYIYGLKCRIYRQSSFTITGSITHNCYQRDDACVEPRPKCRKWEESRANESLS